MNYPQTLDYLYSRLPMFTRVGQSAIRHGLDNTLTLCRMLDNPQDKFRSVHIGGTNGKGSTSHMLAAILQSAGYKTGLYTSPHLKDFRERIRLNGIMIPENEIVDFVADYKTEIERLQPSFFEVTVALAFNYFASRQVDIAIIEVGLGGRLDSTNVITPLLSVITNISYDHMNILGNSLQEIASEKAGIIKNHVPVIIGQKQNEVKDVFISKAEDATADLIFASEEWQIEGSLRQDVNTAERILKADTYSSHGIPPKSYLLDLTGTYQLKNLATVLSASEQLQKLGYAISNDHIAYGLRHVKELTGLMGRWQVLHQDPLIICDTGHNEDGIREVLKNIQITPHEKLHMVIGMVKDKDIAKVLQLLPKDAAYYFCQPALERAKPADELASEARVFGLKGESYPSVIAALETAKNSAAPGDLIFIGGSTFVVAEVV